MEGPEVFWEGPERPERSCVILPVKGLEEMSKVTRIGREKFIELSEEKAGAGARYDRVYGVVGRKEEEEEEEGASEENLEKMLLDGLGGDDDDAEDGAEDGAEDDSDEAVRDGVGRRRSTRQRRPREVEGDTAGGAPSRGASTRKRSGDERERASGRQKRSTRSTSLGAGAGKKAPRSQPASSSAAFTAEVTDEMKSDQALALALAQFDYKPWSALVVESVRRAGGPVVLAEKHANRNRETTREIRGGRVVLEDVVHRNGLLYDGKFAQE